MKTLSTLLLASLFLVFNPLQAMACGISPTAQIDAFPDNVVFVGTTMLFEGYGSSANCGYLTTFRWQVDGITVSTDPEYVASLTLPAGQSIKRYDVQLRVRNSGGLYGYANIAIAVVRDHKSYYYLTDHLGSVRVTVNDAGAPVGWDDYYPFGLQMPGRTQNASNPNDDQKFTGYELEQQGDLGLYHAGARMYDPAIGRFSSQDRFKEKYPSMSPYQYAALNPISFIDVNGDSIWIDIDRDNRTITLNYQGKLINESGKNIDLDKALNDISSSLEKLFSNSVSLEDEGNFSLNVNVDISVADSRDELSESDHALVIADLSPFDSANAEARGWIAQEGDKTAFVDQRQFYHRYNPLSLIFPNNTRSALHEMGHQFGMGDLRGANQIPGNLMNSGSYRRGNNLTPGQNRNVIFYSHRKLLNRGSNRGFLPIKR